MPALRLCFDRILPARRDRPMGFEMPKIETAADAAKASSAVLAACAAGELLPSEAAEVMDLVATEPARLHVHPFPGGGLYPFLTEFSGLRSLDLPICSTANIL